MGRSVGLWPNMKSGVWGGGGGGVWLRIGGPGI